MSRPPLDATIVTPTVGRPSLQALLDSLGKALAAAGTGPVAVVLVDDRPGRPAPLEVDGGPFPVQVVRPAQPGSGPAAARNAGWRQARSRWVAFVDDDVLVTTDWLLDLATDLGGAGTDVAASQGRITVPLPAGRRPTDWERNVAGLERARWATADMAYRRDVLAELGGFDERFPRAFREDADLGRRAVDSGYRITIGGRRVLHPVRPAGRWVSVSLQAGNADDVLMRVLHGPQWRRRVGAGMGRNGRHLAVTAALAGAVAAGLAGRPQTAAALGGAWAAGTTRFAWQRIAPGPRTPGEILTMAITSAAVPPAAVAHMAAGLARLPKLLSGPDAERSHGPSAPALRPGRRLDRFRFGAVPRPLPPGPRPSALLFDRDGTLVYDRPPLRQPGQVALVPGARRALALARDAGLAVAVVTNQPAVGSGTISNQEMEGVHAEIAKAAGPIDHWAVCCHRPQDGCSCRKPQPGLIHEAAARLGVEPHDCVVIGDTEADLLAARRAGARSVLVPNRRTRPSEVRAAAQVAADVLGAVGLALEGRC